MSGHITQHTTLASTAPALADVLAAGIAWLDMDQPDGAIQQHHGAYRQGAQWNGRIKIRVVPQGYAGSVAAFNVANGVHGDDGLTNPFTAAEVAALESAVAQVAAVVTSWNGVGAETFSVSFQHTVNPSLAAALTRCHDLCPEHRPKLHCGWSPPTGTNCPWYRTGHALMVYPQGWVG